MLMIKINTMKRFSLYISILSILAFISCKKETSTTSSTSNDSINLVESNSIETIIDSSGIKKEDSILNNKPFIKEDVKKGLMREIQNNKIIRTIDAARLPVTIDEEFTQENQELVLKILHFPNKNISAKINTDEKDFNIRFNQIKTPNGQLDGPFGRDLSYELSSKGEILLIIGKSNMASGKTMGLFSVSID